MTSRLYPTCAILAGLILAVGFGGTPAAARPAHAAEARSAIASARPAIEKADADWFADIQAGDPERLAAPYAQDGLFIGADGAVHAGKPAIIELYRARSASKRRAVSGEIVRDGLGYGGHGLVYEWGHGHLVSINEAGKTVTSGGPYLTVWRRDAGGQWAIARNLVF